MKKLWTVALASFLLLHAPSNTKTLVESAEENLTKKLKDISANKLQQERDIRWNLTTKHPQAGFYGAMAQPYNAALNNLKSKGVIPREKPSENTRLHEWTYVCAHNAFSSQAHGFGLYKQQDLSMTEQLNRGVQSLMLDLWLSGGIIRLTHGEPKYDKLMRGLAGDNPLKLFQEGMHLEKEMKKLKTEFFDKPENKGEVIFLILEDYINDRALLDKTLEKTGLAPKILQPSEWDPVKQNGWPTFKWMKNKNKQIVIFTSKSQTKYTYPQWKHMYENNYDKIDNQGASVQRSDSSEYNEDKRYFYLFNFFKDYAGEAFSDIGNVKDAINAVGKFLAKFDYYKINGPDLLNAINYSFVSGPALIKGRYPNFLSIDFIEKGGVFKTTDSINKKARSNPSKYYRPIQGNKAM